jgi:hypothetical protein
VFSLPGDVDSMELSDLPDFLLDVDPARFFPLILRRYVSSLICDLLLKPYDFVFIRGES